MSRVTRRDLTATVATAALSTVAAVLVTWPLARRIGSATMSAGEVLLTAWQLNWYQHALLTDPRTWIDANIFFPYENAATFNDLLITHAIVTLPAAWAESPVLALNLALLGGIVLCGLCAHLLIRELVDAPLAAVAGGTLFALAPFRFLHLGHLSIAAAWAVPLFFWALLRHLRQPSWVRAAAAAACGLAVALSSLYHAAYVGPIVPLVLLFGARRGPGGRQAWLPLLGTGLPTLALLVYFLVPFATTQRLFGVAAAPYDLFRYGADLSSLGQKPYFLGGAGEKAGISAEALLYPGAALALLSAAGAVITIPSVLSLRGWRRHIALAFIAVVAASAFGLLLPLQGLSKEAWTLVVLASIWCGPIIVLVWAVAETNAGDATGPAAAIRLGLAGAALSFVLALGPEARYMTEPIGPAPYTLLVQASSAFEGTRVPARFGGIVILFLALMAAGALAALARHQPRRYRFASVGVAATALVACFSELPVPRLPQGHDLVPLPRLRDHAYRWIGEQPGRVGILELPDWPTGGGTDYEYRTWRALRYMLASKQHGKDLVNGTGRIEPFLWHRFLGLEPWSDDFFTYIAAYFPVDYVLVHESGIPARLRGDVLAKLDRGAGGLRRVFRSSEIRIYAIDRSFGKGTSVDRFLLRREIAPLAHVSFSARIVTGALQPSPYRSAQPSATLELLRYDTLVGTFDLDISWRRFQVSVAVDAAAVDDNVSWPGRGVLFRWRTRGETPAVFEIKDLSIARGDGPRD